MTHSSPRIIFRQRISSDMNYFMYADSYPESSGSLASGWSRSPGFHRVIEKPEESGYEIDVCVEHGFHVVDHDRRITDDRKRSFSLFSYNRKIFGDCLSDRLPSFALRFGNVHGNGVYDVTMNICARTRTRAGDGRVHAVMFPQRYFLFYQHSLIKLKFHYQGVYHIFLACLVVMTGRLYSGTHHVHFLYH